MNNLFDLQTNPQFKIKSTYDFLINLLDELFGKDSYKDTIKIENNTESEKNHTYILNNWDMIHTLYKTPNCISKRKKLVRQTLKQIVSFLNQTYQFSQPIKFEQKRDDHYQKGQGIVTKYWIELILR